MTVRQQLTLGSALAGLLIACTPNPSAQPAQEQPSSSAEATSHNTPKSSASSSIIDGETYQVLLPQAPNELLKVEPKVGYKVNKDFPHRVTLKGPSESVVNGSHTESLLTFSVQEGAACPEKQCKAVADFSICNDQMCKLYRGVELSWSAP